MISKITQQVVAPLQQWLLEQGKCLTCGEALKPEVKGSKATVVKCPCGETYLYLPKANLYKRLNANKYVR